MTKRNTRHVGVDAVSACTRNIWKPYEDMRRTACWRVHTSVVHTLQHAAPGTKRGRIRNKGRATHRNRSCGMVVAAVDAQARCRTPCGHGVRSTPTCRPIWSVLLRFGPFGWKPGHNAPTQMYRCSFFRQRRPNSGPNLSRVCIGTDASRRRSESCPLDSLARLSVAPSGQPPS